MKLDASKPIKSVNLNGTDAPLDILNIAYGTTPPADATRLWVPLEQKPDNVEVNGEYMNFGQNVLETWKEGDPTIAPYTELYVGFAASVGNSIYIVDSKTKTIIEYNLQNNTFTECCSYDGISTDVVSIRKSCCFTRGTDIFLSFSNPASKLYRFDTVNKTFEEWMSVSDFNSSTVVEYGGYAYKFMEYSSSSQTINGYVTRIDLDNKTYARLEKTVPHKCGSPVAWVYEGKIFLFIEAAGDDDLYLYAFNPADYSIELIKSDTQSASKYKNFGLDCDLAFNGMSNFENAAQIPVIGSKVYLFPTKKADTSKWNANAFIFDMETLMFTESNPIINTVDGYGRKNCGLVLRDMKIYIIGGYNYKSASSSTTTTNKNTRVEVYRIETLLENNHLKIFTDMFGKQTALVNAKDCNLYATVREAYIGNEDGYARPVDSYIYDKEKQQWQTVDGVSVTQDMLNALAELGVT